MKANGYYVEFSISGQIQFSAIVQADTQEQFLAVWNAAGSRLFFKLTGGEDQVHGYGEFRIRPILD